MMVLRKYLTGKIRLWLCEILLLLLIPMTVSYENTKNFKFICHQFLIRAKLTNYVFKVPVKTLYTFYVKWGDSKPFYEESSTRTYINFCCKWQCRWILMLVQNIRNLTLQEKLHVFLWYLLILSPTFLGKLS